MAYVVNLNKRAHKVKKNQFLETLQNHRFEPDKGQGESHILWCFPDPPDFNILAKTFNPNKVKITFVE
jgi:hypothetical protein